MKTLYLLRHAKSSWEDSDLADFDRPLATRGQLAATAMGDYFAREDIHPDLVICSSARRARETLERVQAAWGWRVPTVFDPVIYHSDAAGLLELVQDAEPEIRSLMLVGHNPAMESLAHLLAGSGDEEVRATMLAKFPTCGLAELLFDGDDWTDLASGKGSLRRFVTPKGL